MPKRKPKPAVVRTIAMRTYATEDYSMFERDPGNRLLDKRGRGALWVSINEYGWIPNFPMVCRRVGNKLFVMDGWNRLTYVKSLDRGLTVYWTETSDKPGPKTFRSSVVNRGVKSWSPENYAVMFAAQGKPAYKTGLEFARKYNLRTGPAFGLLAGLQPNCEPLEFRDGTFSVMDYGWAERVMELANAIEAIIASHSSTNMPQKDQPSEIYRTRMIEACAAVYRWPGFNSARFLKKAKQAWKKFRPYSTKQQVLDTFEEIYNHGESKHEPLCVNVRNGLSAFRKSARGPAKSRKRRGAGG